MRKEPPLQFEETIFDDFVGKDFDYVETPPARGVFALVGIIAVVIVGVAVGRIGFLSVAQQSRYVARADANINQETIIPAYRGVITDRFGTPLASNSATFSVFANIPELLRQGEAAAGHVRALAEALSLPEEEFWNAIKTANLEEQSAIPFIRDVSAEEAIKVKGLSIPGLTIRADYSRFYEGGFKFAAAVGYTGLFDSGSSLVGKTGLEARYDDELRGTDGSHVFYRDVHGTLIGERRVVEPKAGEELRTTLDAEFQEYFYGALQAQLRSLGLTGAVGIAMNPATGDVLSLISLPSFDNNIFANRRKSADRKALLEDQRHPLFDRVVSGLYAPGSVIKPLVALAALREGVVIPETVIFSPGYLEVPNPYAPEHPTRFSDWRPHGNVDLAGALARSSNVYFYTVGGGSGETKGLGIDRLKRYWQFFGLGKKTGIDIEAEEAGFLPDPETKERRTRDPWRIGDTYNVSIGQGDLLTTPIQLLSFFSSIANGGRIIRPRMVLSDAPPEVVTDYSDWQSELAAVRRGLEDAVEKSYGTLHSFNDLPMSAAGKTGTPQIANNTKTNAIVIAYAPAEDPKIAVLVLIENAREGSLNAVPVVKEVLNWYYYHRIATQE